jgi:hypothetical protein
MKNSELISLFIRAIFGITWGLFLILIVSNNLKFHQPLLSKIGGVLCILFLGVPNIYKIVQAIKKQ